MITQFLFLKLEHQLKEPNTEMIIQCLAPDPFFARITSLPWAAKFFSLMAVAGRAAAVRAAFAVIFHVVAVLNMTKHSLSKSIVTQQIFPGTENITNCPV